MLLAFDIGNTNIVVGCFEGDKLEAEFRLKTTSGRTVDEYGALLLMLINQRFPGGIKVNGSIISSVVPPVTPDVAAMVRELFGLESLMIGPGIKTGLPIRLPDPSAVGADRVVNAVAAKEFFGTPALIIDFGTATSFDFVSAEGAYEGGIIAPGLAVAADSLVQNTAKLPRIELKWPATVIGKGTVAAMQSGTVIGYVCLVEGLIDKTISEVGPIKHIIATGGLGRTICEHSTKISAYDPHLTLRGLRLIYALNS